MDQLQLANQRNALQKRYNTARTELLLVIILTVVNIVLFFAGSDSMMLFSASVPFYAVVFASMFGIQELLIAGCILAGIIIVLYFLCWLLSKNRPGWLVAAVVLFAIDTVCMLGLYILAEEVSAVMDMLIHALVLYYLIAGLSSHRKLKKLPQPEPIPAGEEPALPDYSTPIRRADEEGKCRVLLESEYGGHRVCYRRVKRVNELVIDGQVYDEYEALMEQAHILTARIAGHTYEVGYNEQSRVFFKVDGQQIVQKMRWY